MALPALLALIPAIFNGLANIGVKYMERKQVEAQGKVDIMKARVQGEIDLKTGQQQGDQKYDQVIAEQMESSWKDEWLTILISIPVVLCFIPGGAKYVHDGFAALALTPEWFQWSFLGIIIASFGLKSIVRPMLNKWFGIKETEAAAAVTVSDPETAKPVAAKPAPNPMGEGH